MAKKPFDIEDWKAKRQACRTDLWRLCQVLGYKDVKAPHVPIYKGCQQFRGGYEPLKQIHVQNGAGYIPLTPMWQLSGKRKRLFIVTRGGLKTSIITQAHKIQWIINYPDIRIALGSAQLGRAKDFLKGIKDHFLKNELFRYLFPEYCPRVGQSGKIEDFGNEEQFTVPCRRSVGIKEPTVRVISADSSVAGGHYDVLDIDDLEEDQNSRTPMGIEQTKKFFGSLNPLLQDDPFNPDLKGWLDLVGTIHSYSGLHWTIKTAEEKKPPEEREWEIIYLPAATDYGTEKVKCWWPDRISVKKLRDIENDPSLGPGVLYPQYLLKPLQDKNGLITSDDDIKWIPRAELNALKARCAWNVTVDLAGMGTSQGSDTDYECLNLHGWGTDGRCYFDKLIWGRLDPDSVIDWMFKLFEYQPRIVHFKIEAEAHARVLAPYLKKAMAKKKIYLPVMEIKRDNMVSKVHRIRGTQPYWKNGAFRFAADIAPEAKEQLLLEAKYFPKFNHDDILDTIADSLQSRTGIISDVEGREASLPELGPDYDGQLHEWKGIPVANLSQAALQGMEEEEGYSNIFQPW